MTTLRKMGERDLKDMERPQRHGGTDGNLEICCLLNEASIVLCLMFKEI
jgi:hypothetical protein